MYSRWTALAATAMTWWVATSSAVAIDFVIGDGGRTPRNTQVRSATARTSNANPTGGSVRSTVTRASGYPDPSLPVVSGDRSSPLPAVDVEANLMTSATAPQTSQGAGCGPGQSCGNQGLNYVTDGESWQPDYGSYDYGPDSYGPGGAGYCGTDCYSDGGNDLYFGNSQQVGLFVDLWLAQGFTGNYDDPRNNFNLPVTFNDRANEYQMNQAYVSFGRKVFDCGEMWDLGGRVDLLYGTDYFFTTAAGLETEVDGSPKWNSGDGPRNGGNASLYGLALPQAYAEVYVPVLSGLNFKIGHFYTTLGYESVMAPSNFFYSRSYSKQYGEPFTHTGVLTTVPLHQTLNAHFGYTRGWNNWEDLNGKPGYLMGMTWNPDDCSTLALAMHTGREDILGVNDRVVYSLVYSRQMADNVRWVFQHTFGTEVNAELDRQGRSDSAKWYGIANYLYYDLSPNVTWGARVEWFRDQDNARVLAIPSESLVQGGNYVGLTGGLNIRMTPRWLLRPEIRWDWSDVVPPGSTGMFNDFTEDGQILAGFDLIFQL